MSDLNGCVSFRSSEPTAGHAERTGETGRPAAFRHSRRSPGRKQPDEAAADREGKTQTEATRGAPAETAGQASDFSSYLCGTGGWMLASKCALIKEKKKISGCSFKT